ncbi:winged helix-turn-helix transcriptional regulator [Paraflavitalea pollutisoli]|uniref:winged helix-turn-helix transcriptional regulator n=1 Tax=Paraflavitalea pollutisoli TaxID=3034143 RepID=UPI0023ED9D27|nr:helix-turn-helix domain-containing protein [Paraflavitalea sp. H1-2-19X]
MAVIYSPIDTFLQVIKGKYKAKILIYLAARQRRYSEIKRKFPLMSERILIKQLKELEQQGIITRSVTGTKPPLKVQYQLTAYGSTVCPILKQMWFWGEQHEQQAR